MPLYEIRYAGTDPKPPVTTATVIAPNQSKALDLVRPAIGNDELADTEYIIVPIKTTGTQLLEVRDEW